MKYTAFINSYLIYMENKINTHNCTYAGPKSKKHFFEFGPARKIEKRQKSRFRYLTSGPMDVFYALKKKLGV